MLRIQITNHTTTQIQLQDVLQFGNTLIFVSLAKKFCVTPMCLGRYNKETTTMNEDILAGYKETYWI